MEVVKLLLNQVVRIKS